MTYPIFEYWGKAAKAFPPIRGQIPGWHLLPYHCLDVAAVALAWFDASSAVRRMMRESCRCGDDKMLRSWLGFFCALHDLGKFDLRFQLKAKEVWKCLNPAEPSSLAGLTDGDVRDFDHGRQGYAMLAGEVEACLGRRLPRAARRAWLDWGAAVTGHHGEIPRGVPAGGIGYLPEPYLSRDSAARCGWIGMVARLMEVDLSGDPPLLDEYGQTLVAGLCSVSDWLGSNQECFDFDASPGGLEAYLQSAVAKIGQMRLLESVGLRAAVHEFDFGKLLPKEASSPSQVQQLVGELDGQTGLTLIEAPTGSGKTEAALALAWRYLEAGTAESVIFALPTQASANAMLERLEALAPRIFSGDAANLVLAHGKRNFNPAFKRLRAAAQGVGAQGKGDALAQCAHWLGQSRKRAFLGQIGVCTIDQTLMSVLPVRHRFVRSVGLAKSVLIVDEVHAYDRYMICLLDELLKAQRAAGAPVILLSATLPAVERARLLEAWGGVEPEGKDVPYPLISRIGDEGQAARHALAQGQILDGRTVRATLYNTPAALPDDALLARMLEAARQGAKVAVVVNLVADAQKLARDLLGLAADVDIHLFHARYRFQDRLSRETAVLAAYGKDAPRSRGSILIATQVVEQSLDLDFDWLITQLCPVDLLFQRIGRLHRHKRAYRPAGCETPCVTVLAMEGDNFGLHEVIYGDPSILWRTRELLKSAPGGEIAFSSAYRTWLEAVYGESGWNGEADEPDTIFGKHLAFRDDQRLRCAKAHRLAVSAMNPLADTDETLTGFTRDGEMSLNVLPLVATPSGEALLDGRLLVGLDEWERDEAINLNTVPVPAGWKDFLPAHDKGEVRLLMKMMADGVWQAENKQSVFIYSLLFGLEKK